MRFVDPSAPLGGDGTSWQSAHRFLQDALLEATQDPAVSEIRVAAGVCRPDESSSVPGGSGLRSASFVLPSGVALRGGYAGPLNPDLRDPLAFPTVLSGDIAENDEPAWVNHSDNSYHVVTATGVGSSTVLDGVVVKAGYATTGSNGAGAGILLTGASPTIIDCVVTECLASSGAGLYCSGGSPTISGGSFTGNYAWGGRGGALYCDGPAAPVIESCTFAANQAYGAGGVGDAGAVFLSFNCPATFDHCVFVGNSSATSGAVYPTGGAVSSLADDVLFDGCRFLHNVSTLGAGGAVWSGGDGVRFASCEFAGNSATVGGAASIFLSVGVEFDNCTIVANAAGDGGGLSLGYSTSASIANCIFWANTGNAASPYKAAIHKDDSSEADVLWTCIQSMWVPEPGEDPLDPENFPGCTDADPLFVDGNGLDNQYGTLDDDFRLSSGSPLIDAGNNTAVSAAAETDVAGLPRFMDDLEAPDTGVGESPLVDIGAHEHGVSPLFGDLDGDGIVDGADLGLLLGDWGSARGSGGSPADLDGDGTVDGADLGLLLAAWS